MLFRNLAKMRPNWRMYSESKFVALKVDDKSGISVINLQRSPTNCLNTEVLTEINTLLLEAKKNKSRGLVLTSKIEGIFSAGLDVTELYQPDPERLRLFLSTLQETWIKLYGSSYPTVALINGHAPAGGCLLAMSCEYRVMSNNFTIGLNETRLGIAVPSWVVATMQNIIGQRHTELALTSGKMFKTDEALDIGLIDEAVDNTETGFAKALEFLSSYKKISPKARYLSKICARGPTIDDLIKRRQEDLDYLVRYFQQPEVQKPLGMFMEMLKSKPDKRST